MGKIAGMAMRQFAHSPLQVVGASAAGLFTAFLLARESVPVDLLETSPQLDPLPRTLIVTHKMRRLLGPLAEPCITNEISKFELYTDGRSATVNLEQRDLVIERAALIRSLASAAQQAGANLLFGRRFQRLSNNGNGAPLTVHCERVENRAPEQRQTAIVVGSDGVTSRVARAAGWPAQATVPLIQAIVALPPDMLRDTVRVWFVPHDTPYFYWLIPRSATEGVLGLIGEAGAETRISLERFLDRKSLTPIKYEAARIPVYSGWVDVERRIGGGRVFLVGDAAGQVKVTTVGGIVTGLRGALGVAESILRGRGAPELRALRRELNTHFWLRRSLHRFAQADYSRLVDLLNASGRRALSRHTRDEALSVLWRLCAAEPRLILLGLRGLLMRNTMVRGKHQPGSSHGVP
jgi:flavin-dependent dehydrogenase